MFIVEKSASIVLFNS